MKSPNVIRIFNLFQISSKFHLTFATFVVILLSQLQWLKTQSRKSFVQTTVFHRDALAVIEFQKGPFKGKVISEFLSLERLRSTSAYWSALVTLVSAYPTDPPNPVCSWEGSTRDRNGRIKPTGITKVVI